MVKVFARIRPVLLGFAAFALAIGMGAQTSQGDKLEFALLLSRHGVRSSLYTGQFLQPFAAKPWPQWEVPPGMLTPHGGELIRLMGNYFHDYFVGQGLLSGKASVDSDLIFIRADNDQRTIETARQLYLGLLSGSEAGFAPHVVPDGKPDALFQPLRANAFKADMSLGAANVLGRLGGNPDVLERSYARQFADLEHVLYGDSPVPADSPFKADAQITSGEWDNLVKLTGPLRAALITTESLILEYADGKPASEVGWGRVDPAMLTELLELHSMYFDLTARTSYPAQVQGSNLLSHILATLDQAATGKPVVGAIGAPGEKLVIVTGHDTNIANVGGLLDAHWFIDGSQRDPVLPGGALSFELWRHADGMLYVRTAYVCQTLEQMRNATPLSVGKPPYRAQVFVPRASGSGPCYDAPLTAFEAAGHADLNPRFVVPGVP